MAAPLWFPTNWAPSLARRCRTRCDINPLLCKNLLKAQPTWLIDVCTASAWPWSNWSEHQNTVIITFHMQAPQDWKWSPAPTGSPASILLTCWILLLHLIPFLLTRFFAFLRKISVFSIIALQGTICNPIMSKRSVFRNKCFERLKHEPFYSNQHKKNCMECCLHSNSYIIDFLCFFKFITNKLILFGECVLHVAYKLINRLQILKS